MSHTFTFSKICYKNVYRYFKIVIFTYYNYYTYIITLLKKIKGTLEFARKKHRNKKEGNWRLKTLRSFWIFTLYWEIKMQPLESRSKILIFLVGFVKTTISAKFFSISRPIPSFISSTLISVSFCFCTMHFWL